MTNCVDPDQTPRSAASDLGLHCLLMHVCPNSLFLYSIMSLTLDFHFLFIMSISETQENQIGKCIVAWQFHYNFVSRFCEEAAIYILR